MKTLTKILLILFMGVTLIHASAFTKEAKYKKTKIVLSSQKPLSVGTNTLTLHITKKSKVIKNAKVSIKAFMPAMPGMPAMEYETDTKELKDGVYEGKVQLSMHGTWQIHIFITPQSGKKSRVKSSLTF
ncbi:hypothetical protein GJV85_12340 [Sulfurimonas aquatica]|uniref:YtkA-like domain-containing protein n=1 Tax=Sulfurimonas aquatica TaxID=2672570 RepID=A0A975GDY5_9BACT|nr:FixH family protein [Sulfurimonas aquatica]QSZ42863.1 hypothetical protein GJV85_12340 [Sulfurimonas aquatica]